MLHYYTMDIAHFMKDTAGMSAEQIGIYIMICHHYFANEGLPIPLDISKLCKIILPYTGLYRSKPKILQVLNMSFELTWNGYQNKRFLHLISKCKKNDTTLNDSNLWTTCGQPVDNFSSAQSVHESCTNRAQSVQALSIEINNLSDFELPTSLTSVISRNNNVKNETSSSHLEVLKTAHVRSSTTRVSSFPADAEFISKCEGFNFIKFISLYPKMVTNEKKQKAHHVWVLDGLESLAGTVMKSVQDRIEKSDCKKKIGTPEEKYIPDPYTFLKNKMYDQDFEEIIDDYQRIISETKKWTETNK